MPEEIVYQMLNLVMLGMMVLLVLFMTYLGVRIASAVVEQVVRLEQRIRYKKYDHVLGENGRLKDIVADYQERDQERQEKVDELLYLIRVRIDQQDGISSISRKGA